MAKEIVSDFANNFLKPFFESLETDLARAQKLLNDPDHFLDAILLICCHIGSYSKLRYPRCKDNKAFKTVVIDYSGMSKFYEQIDLLYFCQWPKSVFKDDSRYKKFQNYNQILNVIQNKYGNEQNIKMSSDIRYISPDKFIGLINENSFKGYDSCNFNKTISLFSLVELLYGYVRCYAVHDFDFPVINKHAITGEILGKTAKNILDNLKNQCIAADKWPHDL